MGQQNLKPSILILLAKNTMHLADEKITTPWISFSRHSYVVALARLSNVALKSCPSFPFPSLISIHP
jgi:hypothetical protein